MNKTTLLGLSAAAVIIGALPATAADLRPAPVPVRAPIVVATSYNWTGCYIGIHGGGARGDKSWHSGGVAISGADHDADGWLVGGQVGCNWQSGQWVFGVEGSAAWADLSGHSQVTGDVLNVVPGATSTWFHSETDLIGSIAGRIGWAFDRTLLYAKGGAAFINQEHWISITNPGGVVATRAFNGDSDLRWGWVLGGGLEYAFGNNWSGKVEYNYMNFGDNDGQFCPVTIGGNCLTHNIDQQVHLVKLGVNYRFGGGR